MVIFAKKYGHILDSGDATALMTLSPSNRKHALCALAALSKYQGRYDQYLQLKQRYSLKWSSTTSVQSLERFFNPDLTFDVMLSKVKEMIQALPEPMALVIKHAVLTGLRPAEAVESVRLLNGDILLSSVRSGGEEEEQRRQQQQKMMMYYNPERQTLEHFRFPDVFLRQTKKAFISYITLDDLEPIAKMAGKTPTWNAIRLACRRRKLNMNMSLTRKLFASHLRQEGIQPEIIDMLQGRVSSQSILTRHYLVPQSTLRNDVLSALNKLKQEIER